MIKSKDEMRRASVVGLRGGVGELYQCHVLEKDETGGRMDMCCVFTIMPGRTIGIHTHDTNSEVYYMLKGEIVVNQDGVEHTVKEGGVVFTADGASHSVENRTDEPAEMLAIILPH